MRDYLILDVFTDVPLEGNQVAVFTDGSELSDGTMQRTAREMNLSETVFILPGDVLRIFTPTAELPFAGHPVLGTAFVVAERDGVDDLLLNTGAGPIRVTVDRERAYGEMEQPVPTVRPFERPDAVLAAVGVERSELPVEVYENGPRHVYVMLPEEQAVAALEPDLAAIGRLGAIGVSCFAGSGTKFKTRMFGPGLGVPEDPATGSAAGPLAVHLARHGVIEFGQEIEIRQGEEIMRPSLIRARVDGARDSVAKVVVGGSAVLVASGRYRLA